MPLHIISVDFWYSILHNAGEVCPFTGQTPKRTAFFLDLLFFFRGFGQQFGTKNSFVGLSTKIIKIQHAQNATHNIIADQDIEMLDVSERAYNVLKGAGRDKVSDLIGLPMATLCSYRNCGETSVVNIIEKLMAYLEKAEAIEVENSSVKLDAVVQTSPVINRTGD